MSRLFAPDRGCVEVDVGPTRYRGTVIEPVHPQHEKWLREAGYGVASVGGVTRAAGHRCPVCGFASFFKACSRCRDRQAATDALAAVADTPQD